MQEQDMLPLLPGTDYEVTMPPDINGLIAAAYSTLLQPRAAQPALSATCDIVSSNDYLEVQELPSIWDTSMLAAVEQHAPWLVDMVQMRACATAELQERLASQAASSITDMCMSDTLLGSCEALLAQYASMVPDFYLSDIQQHVSPDTSSGKQASGLPVVAIQRVMQLCSDQKTHGTHSRKQQRQQQATIRQADRHSNKHKRRKLGQEQQQQPQEQGQQHQSAHTGAVVTSHMQLTQEASDDCPAPLLNPMCMDNDNIVQTSQTSHHEYHDNTQHHPHDSQVEAAKQRTGVNMQVMAHGSMEAANNVAHSRQQAPLAAKGSDSQHDQQTTSSLSTHPNDSATQPPASPDTDTPSGDMSLSDMRRELPVCLPPQASQSLVDGLLTEVIGEAKQLLQQSFRADCSPWLTAELNSSCAHAKAGSRGHQTDAKLNTLESVCATGAKVGNGNRCLSLCAGLEDLLSKDMQYDDGDLALPVPILDDGFGSALQAESANDSWKELLLGCGYHKQPAAHLELYLDWSAMQPMPTLGSSSLARAKGVEVATSGARAVATAMQGAGRPFMSGGPVDGSDQGQIKGGADLDAWFHKNPVLHKCMTDDMVTLPQQSWQQGGLGAMQQQPADQVVGAGSRWKPVTSILRHMMLDHQQEATLLPGGLVPRKNLHAPQQHQFKESLPQVVEAALVATEHILHEAASARSVIAAEAAPAIPAAQLHKAATDVADMPCGHNTTPLATTHGKAVIDGEDTNIAAHTNASAPAAPAAPTDLQYFLQLQPDTGNAKAKAGDSSKMQPPAQQTASRRGATLVNEPMQSAAVTGTLTTGHYTTVQLPDTSYHVLEGQLPAEIVQILTRLKASKDAIIVNMHAPDVSLVDCEVWDPAPAEQLLSTFKSTPPTDAAGKLHAQLLTACWVVSETAKRLMNHGIAVAHLYLQYMLEKLPKVVAWCGTSADTLAAAYDLVERHLMEDHPKQSKLKRLLGTLKTKSAVRSA